MSISSQQQLVDVKQRLQPSQVRSSPTHLSGSSVLLACQQSIPLTSMWHPQTVDVRRAAFETLIGLSKCEDPKVKVQVGELLPQPFATVRPFLATREPQAPRDDFVR